MSILVNNYPIFEDNQVLNSGQLNQLIKYLDQQERLTRSCLIGMGIACGLELEIVKGNKPAVIIHEGIGVSSEGFLIKLCPESKSCVTVQYRDYNLPEGAIYTPFQNQLFEQDIELFELLTNKFESGDDEKIEPLTNDFLKDKVVVLFLECLDKDLKSCLGKSCDELGVDRIFTLRKLAISTKHMDKVNARSNTGRQDDLFLEKFSLKDISLPRVILERINTVHYLSFAYKHVEAIEMVYKPMRDFLNLTYTTYEPILSEVYDGNPFEHPKIKDAFEMLDKYLQGELVQPVWLGIQYVYDFFKDLILAYQEFKDCAYDLMLQCCPDMTRFPRHLMLGTSFDTQKGNCELDKYRHLFTQPPIYNHQSYLLAKTLSLHKRMVLLIEKFSFERLQHSEKGEHKLTPSCEKKSLLSERSIPFYYESTDKSVFSKLENLELEWNYERNYRRCQVQEEKSKALNLSYDNNTMDTEADSPLTTPLHFDIDHLNFLRVEGLQGKGIDTALSSLEKMRKEALLDFDVKYTYFGDLLPKNDRLDCIYGEFQTNYEVWRNKFIYLLVGISKLTDLSRFAVTDESRVKNPNTETTGTEGTSNKKDDFGIKENLRTKINSKNWSMATDEVLFRTSSLNMRQWTQGRSKNQNSTGRASGKGEISDLFKELKKCLMELRQFTPEDFKSFNFEQWLERYKCPLRIYIEILKLATERFDSTQITVKINTYVSLICQVHGLLRNLAIYPYIEIGVLKNALQSKIETFNKGNQFTSFMQRNPGSVHKAGTEQGQTFVLLFQADVSERYKEKELPRVKKYLEKNEVNPKIIKEVENFEAELGTVFGDFNIPHFCCNPCDQTPTEVAQLHPIAMPIIETVPISDTNQGGDENQFNSFDYGIVKEKLLHEVYEIERYKAKLSGDLPKFGTASIEFAPSDLNEDIMVPYLRYKVDVVAIIGAGTDSGYLIDEFSYQFFHERTGELLDTSSITILIPNIETNIQVEKVGIKGRVITFANEEERPIEGAVVKFDKFPDLQATSIGNGEFAISTVSTVLPNGTHEVTIAASRFIPKTMSVTINNNIPFITVELVPLPFGVPIFTDFFVILGEDPNSEKSVRVINDFRKTNTENKQRIRMLIEKEGDRRSALIKTEKTISLFANDETLSTKEINTLFTKNRDGLLKQIKSSRGDVRKLKTEGLKTLTTAYLDRISLTEPKQLSEASKKTMAQTTELYESSRINMKTELNKWALNRTEVLGNTIVSRFKTNMKLR